MCRCLWNNAVNLRPLYTPVMPSNSNRLAALVICAAFTGCFEHFGVDGLSASYLRHRRAVEGCQELMTDNSVSLTSPGYPENYTNDVDCWTLIKVGEDQKVLLTFEFVDLEDAKNCKLDYVEVRDGDTENAKVLGRLCKEKERKSFESTSRSLMVHFHSDKSVNAKGFLAQFKAIIVPQGGCSWEQGENGGMISSPGYPENYPSATHCNVVVVSPENSTILFDIETVQLEMDANCSLDFLTISEGTPPDVRLLGRFCGLRSEPNQMVSAEREVRVQFHSDDFLQFTGFKLRYRFVHQEVDQVAPSFSVVPGNVSVPEGSSLVLPCDTLHPNTSIRWRKEEVNLVAEAPLPGLRLLSNGSLWIKNMRRQLEGAYTCVAKWSGGQVATVAHVTIGEDCDVEFRLRPPDSEFKEDELGQLNCQAEGSLRWLKDGWPLETDDRVTVLQNGVVVLSKVHLEDAGTYTCVAEDSNGCVGKAAAMLKVLPKIRIKDICGVSPVSQNLSHKDHVKIVKGSDALEGAYPWQVMFWSPKYGAFCGGTLINERWVVTAAHCFKNVTEGKDNEWQKLRLRMGKHKRLGREESEQEYSILDPAYIVEHPNYDDGTLDNDLALVRTDSRVQFSNRVLPACLGDRNLMESLLHPGIMGVVIGWGKLRESGPQPKYLQETHVPVVEQEQCKASTYYTVTHNMFCAGYKQDSGDACKGDSGGPFQVNHEGRWHVVGAVSWGEGCGRPSKYGFYTRIANHLPWIRSITGI